ncbi:unnamed protein product [Anisakis simplex]|uniref:Methyltranfer_dom domain-containing protein n=1 Tax=Anisakis simplex TaxID=6269 RepID=A0A0M3K2I9_ANISI|nr:unnamed protein product [Anisakis simplex]
MSRSNKLFKKFFLLVVSCAMATMVFYWISADWPVVIDDQNYGILSNLDASFVVLEKKCSTRTNICFIVMDRINFQTNKAIRHLMIEGSEDTVEAAVQLMPPEGANVSISDTRIWLVDHDNLLMSYTNVMAIAPLLTSSLDLRRRTTQKAKILCVGVGAATIDVFLARSFPSAEVIGVELEPAVVGLAKKWFRVDKQPNYQLIIMNGVRYIMQTEEQFDAIIIDACSLSQPLACPSPEFLDEALIEKISLRVLKDRGTVVVNIMTMQPADKMIANVLRLFKQHFKNCFAIRMEGDNVILMCSKSDILTHDTTEITNKLNELIAELHIKMDSAVIERIILNL